MNNIYIYICTYVKFSEKDLCAHVILNIYKGVKNGLELSRMFNTRLRP